MKALGFNTLRKHIKIEPEQFYYDCDRLGMIVFQDMVNCGEYSFLRDTLLPTLGFVRLRDLSLHRNPETRENFLRSMEQTVSQLRNHPCVCLWTIFNEGWGHFCADDAYRRLRALYADKIIPLVSQGLFGAIYTQVSDVEDETNGLVTFDRRMQKIRPEELADISERLCKTIEP